MRNALNRRQLLRAGAGSAAALAASTAGAASAAPQERKSRMRLGIVTYNVAKDWDFETLLKNCKASGMEAVEFRTTHAHGVEPAIDAARRHEIKERCVEAGLLQTSLGTTCEFHSPDPAVVRKQIETCREFVVLAKDIGARGVKVRPNGLPSGVPVEKTLEQIGKSLVECGKIAADHGVEIWMEVHGAGTQEPANSRRIMDHCGHPSVGITWNSNPTDVKDGSVKESLALLRPFIKCLHVTQLWSDYPYRELFALLNESGYDRFALCEVGAPIKAEDGIPFLQCYRGLWKELNR